MNAREGTLRNYRVMRGELVVIGIEVEIHRLAERRAEHAHLFEGHFRIDVARSGKEIERVAAPKIVDIPAVDARPQRRRMI